MKNKLIMKKLTAFAASLVISVSSVGASLSAFAADPQELPVLPVVEPDNIPSKYDLRNLNGKNYVTPVKYQNPFGTCWSFASAAAAETTYLYENGLGVPAGQDNNYLNISEKHTVWYTFNKITKDDVSGNTVPASQIGEGQVSLKGDPFEEGGRFNYGFDTYARYGGPVSENTVINGETPFTYNGKNKWVAPADGSNTKQKELEKQYLKGEFVRYFTEQGGMSLTEILQKFDQYWEDDVKRQNIYDYFIGVNKNYAAYDDWTLPVNSQYRLADPVTEVKSYKLFSPLDLNDSYDEEYKFSQERLDAVKKEISSGHAMVMFVLGDSGVNLSETEKTYINTETWAQYVNKKTLSDHAVTIVGYDDSYSKQNFARKDENGNIDPASIPEMDGAFIVKNSYGYVTDADRKTAKTRADGRNVYERVGASEFGYQDSGYYFVSYNDMSITCFSSVELYKAGEQHAESANQYDLMPNAEQFIANRKDTSSRELAANVFTSQNDEYLSEIAVYAAKDNDEIRYSIYKNPKSSDPASGELLESGTKKFDVSGYYRFALDNEYLLRKGDKYSVVVEQIALKNKDADTASSFFSVPYSFQGSTGVVNKGESFVYTGGKWLDLVNDRDKLKQECMDYLKESLPAEELKIGFPNGIKDISFDNLTIRAYTTSAAVRFAGKNRYDTAAKISSESGLFDNSDTVVIANGVNFADALAGVPLAKAYNAPILLTAKDMLPVDTANEIKRLGASNAIILGGPGAVSETVEKELTKMGLTTKRLSGQTRFATAKRVAEALEKQTGKAATEVFFVIYNNFADALSASTVAAAKGAPILYVTKEGAVDKFTELYLEKNKANIKKAYVIGGDGVITDEMKDSLSGILGGKTVERVWGANRYSTCVAVNEKFAGVLKGKDLCIAKGGDFPDALAGGVLAALNESPLFLAGPVLVDEQIKYLSKKKIDSVYVFGGTGAVPETVVKSIIKYLA